MTTARVWSGSTGTEDGLTWDTAWHTVPSAKTGQSLTYGDLIMVHTGTTPHLESAVARIIWVGTTRDHPLYVVGVDKDNNDAYNISTVDNVVTTGATNDIEFDAGFAIYGLRFNAGDDIFTGLYIDEIFYAQDCVFTTGGATSQDFLCSYFNRFVNCTFDVGEGQLAVYNDLVELINPTFIGTQADGFIKPGLEACRFDIIGGDFTSTDNSIYEMSIGSANNITFTGCVEHATHPIVVQSADKPQTHIDLIGCDTVAGNNQWRMERILTSDKGSIVLVDTIYRSSGECTYDGTNEYSMKYATGVNGCYADPLTSTWNSMYVAAADGKNIKVYIASTASRTDKDIWIEVEYFSSTSTTLKTVAISNPPSPVDTATTLPTATGEVWDGITESPSGGQYMTLPSNIDIKKSGMLRWRVKVGLVLSDTYVCMAAEIV